MNIEHATDLVEFLEKFPEFHQQQYWLKRSTNNVIRGCGAGWAATLAGAEPVWLESYAPTGHAAFKAVLDGETDYIFEIAQKWLDLSEDDADELFDGMLEEDDMLNLLRKWISEGKA
jgi:hypothetical protein